MTRKGSDVLLEVLADEGITHIFGNPGTTELPLMDALAGSSDFDYVLGLQEASVVAMADGYALATRKPAFVNLHAAPGLGNGMGNLYNAWANRSPLVVTVGQQHSDYAITEPLLYGDVPRIAEGAVKESLEVRSVGDLEPLLRRALHDVRTDRWGPVAMSLPEDVLEATPPALAGGSRVRRTPPTADPAELTELADLLVGAAAGRVAFVLCDEVGQGEAEREAIQLAEALGATIFITPLNGRYVAPWGHPLTGSPMPTQTDRIRALLADYDRVLVIGGQPFLLGRHTPGSPIPEGTDLLHLSPEPGQLGRVYPTRLGVCAELKSALATLTSLVDSKVDRGKVGEVIRDRRASADRGFEKLSERALGRYELSPAHPMAALHATFAALPGNTVLVQEAISASFYLPAVHRPDRPGTYFANKGAGIGWGMPASVGVSIGYGGERVVCVVGDGSAMYSPQALWTAANRSLPVLFVVINNRQYFALRAQLDTATSRSAQTGRYIGMDLDDPVIDFKALAASMGVPFARAERPRDVGDQLRAALETDGPYVLELPVGTP